MISFQKIFRNKKVKYTSLAALFIYLVYLFTLPPASLNDAYDDWSIGGDSIVDKVRSPDGKFVAEVYERGFGATTSLSHEIFVRPTHPGREFWWAGKSKMVAHLNESSNFYINWLSPTELELQCAECKEIVPLQPDTEIDGRKIKIHILENIKDWQKLSPGFLLEERYAKSLGKSNIKNASFDRKFPEQATKAFANENYFPPLDMSPYFAKAAFLINENWMPPHASTCLKFRIVGSANAVGIVENFHIVSRSGDSNFDKAAFTAFQSALKLGCVPYGAKSTQKILCTMTYFPNAPELGACHKVNVNGIDSRLRR